MTVLWQGTVSVTPGWKRGTYVDPVKLSSKTVCWKENDNVWRVCGNFHLQGDVGVILVLQCHRRRDELSPFLWWPNHVLREAIGQIVGGFRSWDRTAKTLGEQMFSLGLTSPANKWGRQREGTHKIEFFPAPNTPNDVPLNSSELSLQFLETGCNNFVSHTR